MAQVSTATRFTTIRLRNSSCNAAAANQSLGVDEDESLDRAAPFIQDRLYFTTCRRKPTSTPTVHYFSIDDVYVYMRYNQDFGPLNLAMVTKYCKKINRKLKLPTLTNKKIVHVTGFDQKKRVNAAFLIAAYGVLYLKMSPAEAHRLVSSESQTRSSSSSRPNSNANGAATNNSNNLRHLVPFRDASVAHSCYDLHLVDVLSGLKHAVDSGFYDPESFDVVEYEHREQVEHGDSNWILPKKLLAFCGPHPRARVDASGFPFHSPESYFDYFRSNSVKAVVRFNVPTYEGRRFTQAGFAHYDLYFPDGTTPTTAIVDKFLAVCEKTDGAVAVHCKAGLGRTGTLIACYLMKHFRFTAPEAIGWIRVCRPGSVIGTQQNWLLERETDMWGRGAASTKVERISGTGLKETRETTTTSSSAIKSSGGTKAKSGLFQDDTGDNSSDKNGDNDTNNNNNGDHNVSSEARREFEYLYHLSEGKESANKVVTVAVGVDERGVDEDGGDPRRSGRLGATNDLPGRDGGADASSRCKQTPDDRCKTDPAEEEALSQGDLLNRRKMTMKQNLLAIVAIRSSASSSTSLSVSPETTTTSRRSSGRYVGGGLIQGSGTSAKKESVATSSSAPKTPAKSSVVDSKATFKTPASPISQSVVENSSKKTPPSRCNPCAGAGYCGVSSRGYLTRASAVVNGNAVERSPSPEDEKTHRAPEKSAGTKKRSKEN